MDLAAGKHNKLSGTRQMDKGKNKVLEERLEDP